MKNKNKHYLLTLLFLKKIFITNIYLKFKTFTKKKKCLQLLKHTNINTFNLIISLLQILIIKSNKQLPFHQQQHNIKKSPQ